MGGFEVLPWRQGEGERREKKKDKAQRPKRQGCHDGLNEEKKLNKRRKRRISDEKNVQKTVRKDALLFLLQSAGEIACG